MGGMIHKDNVHEVVNAELIRVTFICSAFVSGEVMMTLPPTNLDVFDLQAIHEISRTLKCRGCVLPLVAQDIADRCWDRVGKHPLDEWLDSLGQKVDPFLTS